MYISRDIQLQQTNQNILLIQTNLQNPPSLPTHTPTHMHPNPKTNKTILNKITNDVPLIS